MPRPRRLRGNVYRRRDSDRLWIWFYDRAGVKRRVKSSAADEQAARVELAGLLRRMARGEDPVPPARPMTCATWAREWVALRRAAGKTEADHEEAMVENHLLPLIGRVPIRSLTSAQVLDVVRALPSRQAANGTGELLSPTTVRHIAAALRLCLREAAKRGVIPVSPWNVDASDLPEREAPAVGDGFTEEQVQQLLTDERVPEDRRALYALEFLTGMRTGEAAIRRWRDWDRTREPLSALRIETAWSSARRVEKPTKTRVRRIVPVHPALARVLEEWQAAGWERAFGRRPTEDDLLVPAPGGLPRANDASWRLFRRDLAALGFPAQRHYESRATFLSLAEAGGADLATVRLLTHPSPKTAADLYRRLRLLWPRLCDAVRAIRVEIPPR